MRNLLFACALLLGSIDLSAQCNLLLTGAGKCSAAGGNFGYETIGGTETADEQPNATKWTAPANGTVTKMFVYTGSTDGGTDVRAAIYSDNAGVPNAKLSESAAAVTATTLGWYEITMNQAITNGTVYWLAIFASDNGMRAFYDAGNAGQNSHDTGNTYPTWPATWAENFSLARKYSIYATYVP